MLQTAMLTVAFRFAHHYGLNVVTPQHLCAKVIIVLRGGTLGEALRSQGLLLSQVRFEGMAGAIAHLVKCLPSGFHHQRKQGM